MIAVSADPPLRRQTVMWASAARFLALSSSADVAGPSTASSRDWAIHLSDRGLTGAQHRERLSTKPRLPAFALGTCNSVHQLQQRPCRHQRSHVFQARSTPAPAPRLFSVPPDRGTWFVKDEVLPMPDCDAPQSAIDAVAARCGWTDCCIRTSTGANGSPDLLAWHVPL
jgi:hypothetical protein